MTNYILPMLALAALPAAAAEPSDSVKSEQLDEIVVEAAAQRNSATSVTYTPSARQKNAAADAISLLRFMGIPQLNVSPLSDAVTTAYGAGVKLFVNYKPATEQDLKGMRTKDVRKVEYLDYPTDPRFRDEEHVVNFIVHEYEYGGYTKLSDSSWFLLCNASNASVFSKFAYKKMTYDLFAGFNYGNYKHGGVYSKYDFHLKDNQGNPSDFIRESGTTDHSIISRNVPLQFRASYSSGKTTVTNTIGFYYNDYLQNHDAGFLRYIPSLGDDYSFRRNQPWNNRSVQWNGDYYFELPHRWSLTIFPSLSYTNSDRGLTYISDAVESGNFTTNTSSETINGNLWLQFSHNFNQTHRFSVTASGNAGTSKVRNSGEVQSDNRINTYATSLSLGYSFNLEKFHLNLRLGANANIQNINSSSDLQLFPRAQVNLNYNPSDKHGIYAWLGVWSNTPTSSQLDPTIIRTNDIIYQKGNPNLKSYMSLNYGVNWSWIPSSTFSLATYAQMENQPNQIYTYWAPYNDGKAAIWSYENGGNSSSATIGTQGTLRLLKNTLQITVGPMVTFDRFDIGTRAFSKTYFRGSADAIYYWKNFNFSLSYYTPYKNLNLSTGEWTTQKVGEYLLGVGWANSDWNLHLYVKNIFESTWTESSIAYSSPILNYHTDSYGVNRHRSLVLDVSYTFGYGKRINRGNELNGSR